MEACALSPTCLSTQGPARRGFFIRKPNTKGSICTGNQCPAGHCVSLHRQSKHPDTSQNSNTEPEVEKTLFLGIVHLLFTLPQVSIRETWISTWGREDVIVTRFSDSLVFRECFQSQTKGEKSKSHSLPPLPNSHQMPGAPRPTHCSVAQNPCSCGNLTASITV